MKNKLIREDIIKQIEDIELDEGRYKMALIKSISNIYIEVDLYKYALTSDNKELVEFAKKELKDYLTEADIELRVKLILNRYGLDIEDGKIIKIDIPEEDKLPF